MAILSWSKTLWRRIIAVGILVGMCFQMHQLCLVMKSSSNIRDIVKDEPTATNQRSIRAVAPLSSELSSPSHTSLSSIVSEKIEAPLMVEASKNKGNNSASTSTKNISARKGVDSMLTKFNGITSKNKIFNPNKLVQQSDSILFEFDEAKTPIVLEKYKLVLFTNPKVGSTVLKQLMRRMMGYDDYYVSRFGNNGIPHKWPANGLNYTSQYTLDEVNEMMTSDKWTRATFVRDPKERLLSAYLMLRPEIEISSDIIDQARKGEIEKEKSLLTIFPEMEGSPPTIANCCRKFSGVDTNWRVLCLNHVLTFEGFLDIIDNGWSHFGHDNTINSEPNVHIGDTFSPELLRKSPGCADIHWSPLSRWRLNPKLYSKINFVGHLESAQQDIRRLLERLDPFAWEKYGASGWGRHRNESMFMSSSTVTHALHTENHLFKYYTSQELENRVEKIYEDDYNNKHLDLMRLPIGQAEAFYRKRSVSL